MSDFFKSKMFLQIFFTKNKQIYFLILSEFQQLKLNIINFAFTRQK
jgi:hypothetical protein